MKGSNMKCNARLEAVCAERDALRALCRRMAATLRLIGEGKPENPCGDPWAFYNDLVQLAREALTDYDKMMTDALNAELLADLEAVLEADSSDSPISAHRNSQSKGRKDMTSTTYFEIIGTVGAGYKETAYFNPREWVWDARQMDLRGRYAIATRDEAEALLDIAKEDDNVEDIRINEVTITEIDEVHRWYPVKSFENKLKRLGITVELEYNIPWIYLNKVNGVKVKEHFQANHGFTAFYYPVQTDEKVRFSDMKYVFNKIRQMINLANIKRWC